MEQINLDNWPRKDHFNFFRNVDYPQYNICANLDITNFLDFVQKHDLSFTYAMMYIATYITNEIVNFRYRIRGSEVVLHERLHPCYTHLDKPDDLFKLITADMKEDIFTFSSCAKEKARLQQEYFDLTGLAGRDDFIYFTCIPWIAFTHISHTISLNKNDCVPRISWGKYFTDNNKVYLPFSVQAHHAFVDGVHMGMYFTKIQNYIDNLHG